MIDVYEMIQVKENQIARVQKEIQALHLVAQILLDQDDAHALSPNGDSGAATFAVETGVFVADLPLGESSRRALLECQSRYQCPVLGIVLDSPRNACPLLKI